MPDTKEVAAFFNRLAPFWDENTVRDESIIDTILKTANIEPGTAVLDVACGTGVLIPDYLRRGASSVTAVDLSEKMAEIAREKFKTDARVTVLTADAETADFGRRFDRIVVYDAFPHFKDPARLIAHLSRALNPGGFLTVAHDRSRENINAHHKGMPETLAADLMPADELAAIFAETLLVTAVISSDRMYQVVGEKRG